jgi:glycosyltransferase involved in cell wall biosynthesis
VETVHAENGEFEGDLKILVMPASYKVGLEGSDPEVSFQLLRSLAYYGFEIRALTHRLTTPDLPETLSVTELGPRLGGTIAEQLFYQLRVYQHAKNLLRKTKFDVIHHMAPFHLQAGFNSLMAVGNRPEKFVLGPVAYNIPLETALVPDTRTRWGSRMDDPRLNLTRFESGLERAFSKFVSSISGFRRVLSQRTLDRADAIIAVNKFSSEAISRHTNKRKIHLIPLGVDTSEFAYNAIPPDGFRIVSFGPLQKRRGLDNLISAVSIVSKQYPQVELCITGDGPHRISLEVLVRKLGLSGKVKFLGYIPRRHLIRVLARSSLYCHPSLHETFGISILEAMSTGRPVVATDAIGPREIVVDKYNGFLVPIGNTEAIATAIIRLFEDPSLTIQMGSNSRKLCENVYDWKLISKRYAEVYSGLNSETDLCYPGS